MKHRFASLLPAAILIAGLAQAAPIDRPQTVRLDRDAVVAGTLVPAGVYRVEFKVGLDTVKFVKDRRTVAEVPGKVGLTKAVYPGTAVHYRKDDGGREQLNKIVFASSNLELNFAGDPAAAEAGSAGAASHR